MSSPRQVLTFPTRDVLDGDDFARPPGALPKDGLPAWKRLPLDCKIPAVWRDHNRILLSRARLGESLNRDFPGKLFDLSDPLLRRVPDASEPHLHDPNLRDFFARPEKIRLLKEEGLLTPDGRVVCTLKEFNDYRAFLRSVLVQEYDQQQREKVRIEDERLEREARIRKEEERKREERLAGMHAWIKEAWAGIRGRSMQQQRQKDLKVINRHIRKCLNSRDMRRRFREAHEHKFQKHLYKKYKSDESLRQERLKWMEEDIRRLQQLIDKQREEKLEAQIRYDEWYARKASYELGWLALEDAVRKERRAELKSARTPKHAIAETFATEKTIALLTDAQKSPEEGGGRKSLEPTGSEKEESVGGAASLETTGSEKEESVGGEASLEPTGSEKEESVEGEASLVPPSEKMLPSDPAESEEEKK